MTENPKKKIKYKSVKVPEKLIDQINKERETNEFICYRSHTEFVIDAICRRLEKVRKYKFKYSKPEKAL